MPNDVQLEKAKQMMNLGKVWWRQGRLEQLSSIREMRIACTSSVLRASWGFGAPLRELQAIRDKVDSHLHYGLWAGGEACIRNRWNNHVPISLTLLARSDHHFLFLFTFSKAKVLTGDILTLLVTHQLANWVQKTIYSTTSFDIPGFF